MSYRTVLERLKALPEEERQLASGQYVWWEDEKPVCGCVLGKTLPELYQHMIAHGRDPAECIGSTANETVIDDIIRLPAAAPLDLAGMTNDEASRLQYFNDHSLKFDDGNEPQARRARYRAVVEELETRVAAEPAP